MFLYVPNAEKFSCRDRSGYVERKLRESTVYLFNNLLWSYIAERVLDLPKAQ